MICLHRNFHQMEGFSKLSMHKKQSKIVGRFDFSIRTNDSAIFMKVHISWTCIAICSTAVAIRGKDGVVFAVEKLVQSKLYEKGANKRIFNIDKHVGMVSVQSYCSALSCDYNSGCHDSVHRCLKQTRLRLMVDNL